MMIHKGQKPYECDICQKRFREKSNYNFHMKKHMEKSKKIENKKDGININKAKLFFNKNDLVMEKQINEFCIKDLKKIDKISTKDNSKENSINNTIIENENNSVNIYNIKNEIKKMDQNKDNDLINNKKLFEFECNNFSFSNEKYLFNEPKELYNNSYNKFHIDNNTTDELNILMLNNDIGNEIKDKILDDYCLYDSSWNEERIFF